MLYDILITVIVPVISETARDRNIVTMEYYNRDLHVPYSRVSFQITLSDIEWLSEIFNDTIFLLKGARHRQAEIHCCTATTYKSTISQDNNHQAKFKLTQEKMKCFDDLE